MLNSNEKEENVFEHKAYFGLAETNFKFFNVNIVNFNVLRPSIKFAKNIFGFNYVIKQIEHQKSNSRSNLNNVKFSDEFIIDPASNKNDSTIFTAGM